MKYRQATMGNRLFLWTSRVPVWRDAPWITLAVLLVGLLGVAVGHPAARINHDCALYLQQAELIVDGGVPYVDFVDTNPPLIMYLNVVPVLLGCATGIPPGVALHGFVVLLLAVSGAEILFLLRRTPPLLSAAERGLILLVWVALSFLVYGRCELGQREHMFVLLYVPYLFLRIARYGAAERQGKPVPTWFTLILGLQAGVGVSIKPHFLIVAVVVELVLLGSAKGDWLFFRLSGRLRNQPGREVKKELVPLHAPENVALLLLVVVYLAHWLFVPAAMREAFFFRWLPMIRGNYAAYDAGYRQIAGQFLRSPMSVILLLATVATAMVAIRHRLRLRNHLLAFAAFATASLVLIFVQKKGWSYHVIPFETAAGMALALLAIQTVRALHRSRPDRSYPARAAATALAAGAGFFVLMTVLIGTSRLPTKREPDESLALRRIIENRTEPGDRVLIVATSVRPAYPMLLQLGRKPGSRYLCSFPIAMFYGDRDERPPGEPIYRRWKDAPAEEQRFLTELRDDVDRLQPRLIIIPDFPGGLGVPEAFNHFDYLTYSGWAEEGLRSYRQLPGPEGWRVFERRP